MTIPEPASTSPSDPANHTAQSDSPIAHPGSAGYAPSANHPGPHQGGSYGQQQPYSQPQLGSPQAPYYQNQAGFQQMPSDVYSTKSKMAAGLLGMFLGALGIHNFYLGNTGKAVCQLLLTLLSFGVLAWVSWIWGLIEGILILSSNPQSVWSRDSEGKLLTT